VSGEGEEAVKWEADVVGAGGDGTFVSKTGLSGSGRGVLSQKTNGMGLAGVNCSAIRNGIVPGDHLTGFVLS
jgi:hypothetical protein